MRSHAQALGLVVSKSSTLFPIGVIGEIDLSKGMGKRIKSNKASCRIFGRMPYCFIFLAVCYAILFWCSFAKSRYLIRSITLLA